MTLSQVFASGAIVALVITAFVHSIGGERFLLRPMFAKRGNAVLEHSLARMVLRFAWHFTSLLWLLLAAFIWSASVSPTLLAAHVLLWTGVTFAAVGLFDLVVSKGKHVGWPLLTLTGVAALLAWWTL